MKHATKVVGVTFEDRQSAVQATRIGDSVDLRRDPDNEHDPNAIRVLRGNRDLGWIPRDLAAEIAPILDGGGQVTNAKVIDRTGGTHRYPTHGCEIGFSLEDSAS